MAPVAVHLLPGMQPALFQLARLAWPAEAIALLGGQRHSGEQRHSDRLLVTTCLPLRNEHDRGNRFAVTPQQFLRGLQALQTSGQEWLGFAHSHPGGLPQLSSTDRRELWPGCLQLVVAGMQPDALLVAAFWLAGSDCRALPVQILTPAQALATGLAS